VQAQRARAGRGGARRGVQVVGRLVQHEQVGRRQERRRQAHAPPLRADRNPDMHGRASRPALSDGAAPGRTHKATALTKSLFLWCRKLFTRLFLKVKSRRRRPMPASHTGALARQQRSRHEATGESAGRAAHETPTARARARRAWPPDSSTTGRSATAGPSPSSASAASAASRASQPPAASMAAPARASASRSPAPAPAASARLARSCAASAAAAGEPASTAPSAV